GSAAFANLRRKSNIADFETVAVWVTVDHEGGMLRAQKIGATRARDFRHRDISRQTFSYSPIVRNHGTVARVKGYERAAGDRDRCGHAGHHVVIAAAVVRIFVANGTYNGQFISDPREFRNGFAELDSRHLGRNWLELPADFQRRVRLGIEAFVMGRAA